MKRFDFNKLTKRHFLFAGIFMSASLSFVIAGSKLHMTLDTEPGNILPTGGVSVADVSAAGPGKGMVNGMIVADAGNYFTFFKYVAGANFAWHAQKTDATGAAAWGGEGQVIATTTTTSGLQSISDGAGGLYYVYDNNDAQPHARRIDSSGTVSADIVLAASGNCVASTVKIGTYGNYYYDDAHAAGTEVEIKDETTQAIISDGAGGFIAWWQGASTNFLCAQRIGSDGLRKWGDAGIEVAVADGSTNVFMSKYRVISDGAGGIFTLVVTSDIAARADHLVVKHINAAGTLSWGANGKTIEPQRAYVNKAPGITLDGGGGVFVGYSSRSAGGGDDSVAVARLDASGTPVVGCNPASLPNSHRFHSLIGDGVGGVIATYTANYPAGRSSSAYTYSGNALAAMRLDGADCAIHAGWDHLDDHGGDFAAGADIHGVGNAVLAGTKVFFWSDNLVASNPNQAVMINLADGTSAWGATYNGGYFASFTNASCDERAAVMVPSGADFLFVMRCVAGVAVSKVKETDGSLDAAFGTAGVAVVESVARYPMAYVGASNGSGGAIAAWQMDTRAFIQDVSSSGSLGWAGPPATAVTVFHDFTQLTPGRMAALSDGHSALVWSEKRRLDENAGGPFPIYYDTTTTRAQFYDAAGTRLGPAGGQLIVTGTGHDNIRVLDLVSDGNNYFALIEDSQNMVDGGKYYIQKFAAAGTAQWGANGVETLTQDMILNVEEAMLMPDGTGGVYLAADLYSGADQKSVVQHVTAAGALDWGANGAAVSTTLGANFKMASDGSGGVYVVFGDQGGSGDSISRVSSAGVVDPGFGANGIVVSTGDSYTVFADDAGNAVSVYNLNGNLFAKKYGPHGAALWSSPVFVAGANGVYGNERFWSASADTTGGAIIVASEGNMGALIVQKLNYDGSLGWGTAHTALLSGALAGGEATIPVDSTAGFPATGGVVQIGSALVVCTGMDATNFTGCVGTPAAAAGASASWHDAVTVETPVLGWIPQIISDGSGGAIVNYAIYDFGAGSFDTHLAYVDETGAISFGSPFTLLAESENPSIARGGNIVTVGWQEDGPGATPFDPPIPVVQHLQLMRLGSTTPVVVGHRPVDGTSGVPFSSIDIGTTSATYLFTNPGNVDSLELYEAGRGYDQRLIVRVADPSATQIVETGLTPNTTYLHRYVVATKGTSTSAVVPEYLPFVTLLNNFDSVTAAQDPVSGAITIAGSGDLPNLKIGLSGVNFVIKSGETVIRDSAYIQSSAFAGLTSAELKPGESYIVTVTPRNSSGILSPAKDFILTMPGGVPEPAKIKLIKTAEKIEAAAMANSKNTSVVQTKELKYTITATNTGKGTAKNFVITDPLSEGLKIKDGSLAAVKDPDDLDDAVSIAYDALSRKVTAAVRVLGPNESLSVSFAVVSTVRVAGKVKNKASASWEE